MGDEKCLSIAPTFCINKIVILICGANTPIHVVGGTGGLIETDSERFGAEGLENLNPLYYYSLGLKGDFIRKIIHIDMDCFYAAVEIRDNPSLKGKPVAVGGRPGGRGVLTTANYEARKFGVRSAMPVNTALRLCPDLILTPINFNKYRKASDQIHEVFKEFTPIIQPLSLDEAYLDVTDCQQFGGVATKIAKKIRQRIFEETALTASAGIAPNKFLAKVASDLNKPNGQVTISPNQIQEFMLTLPVKKIPGVGKVTSEKMHANGFVTCGDLQKLPLEEMNRRFGKWGVQLYDLSRGIDHRNVSVSGERKSLSLERTFGEDLQTVEECLEKIPKMLKDLKNRLGNKPELFERIQALMVKVKFFDFQQTTLEQGEDLRLEKHVFEKMMEEAFWREGKPVRLLGLGVKLKSSKTKSKTRQMELF